MGTGGGSSARPSWTGPILDPTGKSVLDVDTRVATEPGASGGSAARTSFETSAGMARRWRRTIDAGELEEPGPFEVWAALRAEPDVEAEIELRWGPEEPSKAERSVPIPAGAAVDGFRAASLGTVSLEGQRLVLEGWAARQRGSGAMSWDRLWLAPAGSGFVPPVPLLPGGGGGAASPEAPTLPQGAAAPTLPGAAPSPTMPRRGRASRIALAVGIAVVIIAAAVAIPLALTGGEEDAPPMGDAMPSPSPAVSPTPAEPDQANFSGAYEVTITIDSLSSPVEGLNEGDTSTSTWILRSTCPSGPCPTELIGTDFFGTGIKASGDLEGGVFQGTTQASLTCSDLQTGEALFTYTGPAQFEIRITEAETVEGVARAIAFDGEFVYRYRAQGGPTADCPATIVERDSVSGTLLQPPS